MKQITVEDCMSKPVKTMDADASARAIVKEMNKHKVASILVVDSGKPVGIVTERDILQRVIEEGRNMDTAKAKDIMSSPIRCIGSEATVKQASEMMALFRVKKLIVVRGDKPVGIVTMADLVKRILCLRSEALKDWEKAIVQAWESF